MRKIVNRDSKSLVDCTGYVDLPTACVRANKTGFFGLSQRVNPESFDSKDTNIDPRECFFGGRRVELAVQAKRADDYANRSTTKDTSTSGNDVDTGGSGDSGNE